MLLTNEQTDRHTKVIAISRFSRDNYFFNQHFQPLYDVKQKKIENLEFVQGVNLGVYKLVKKQRYRVLVII